MTMLLTVVRNDNDDADEKQQLKPTVDAPEDENDDEEEEPTWKRIMSNIKSQSQELYAFGLQCRRYLRDGYAYYEKFNLHEEVKQTRLHINHVLEKIPSVLIPLPGEHMLDVVKRPVYQYSEQLNADYPYFSMLCRSHGMMIAATSTVTTAYLSRKMLPRRLFKYTTAAAFTAVSVTIGIANLKWYYPKKPPGHE